VTAGRPRSEPTGPDRQAADQGPGVPGAAGGQTPSVTRRRLGWLTRWRSAPLLTRRELRWTVGLTLAFLLVTLDVFVQGPLTSLDKQVQGWDGEARIPWLSHIAWPYDKVGQRSVLIPALLLVAGIVARRWRTWRPVVLAVMSVVALNVVVGALKILIGRSETDTGDPSVLNGGQIYPSGHSSNMVLTGGLIIYLLIRYTPRPPVRRMVLALTVLTTLTCLTSLYIGSHWVTDLISGALVGGLLLQLVIAFDRATARIAEDPPTVLKPVLSVALLEGDRDRVDAVPVARGGLGGVVEDVTEVRPASGAADLGASHQK
jgi:membrane-associated phospholipid phosphatase